MKAPPSELGHFPWFFSFLLFFFSTYRPWAELFLTAQMAYKDPTVLRNYSSWGLGRIFVVGFLYVLLFFLFLLLFYHVLIWCACATVAMVLGMINLE